jgi:hypothetical protein
LLDSFEQLRGGKDSAADSVSVHLGISSGTMIVAPLEGEDDRAHLLATGEPVELARRFCIANRFYGSRVLIGPRTFELASKAIVARPIDFLSGVDVRERHEIYEPLMLAAEATPEQIARRDSFWNGVVLYREKRWAEAYTQFQAARGPNGQDDAPLQLYVRGWSRSRCNSSSRRTNRAGEESRVSGRDPGVDRATAANAGRRAALGGADRALDGAGTRTAAR